MAAVCFGIAAGVNAQTTTIFNEDFEGPWQDIFDAGWDISVTNGSENMGVFNSNPSMVAIGIDGNAIGAATFDIVNNMPVHVADTDIIITSPVIDLPASPLTLSYTVGSLALGASATSHYSVYIITEDEMEGAATPAELSALLDTKMSEDEGTLGAESRGTSFTITDYNGQAVVLVFRLHDSPSNSILLFDDIVIASGTLAGDSFISGQFAVYPNPAADVVTIKGKDGQQLKSVTITDLNGRTVFSKELINATEAQANVAGLGAGVYVMNIMSDRGTAAKRIIKQ